MPRNARKTIFQTFIIADDCQWHCGVLNLSPTFLFILDRDWEVTVGAGNPILGYTSIDLQLWKLKLLIENQRAILLQPKQHHFPKCVCVSRNSQDSQKPLSSHTKLSFDKARESLGEHPSATNSTNKWLKIQNYRQATSQCSSHPSLVHNGRMSLSMVSVSQIINQL